MQSGPQQHAHNPSHSTQHTQAHRLRGQGSPVPATAPARGVAGSVAQRRKKKTAGVRRSIQRGWLPSSPAPAQKDSGHCAEAGLLGRPTQAGQATIPTHPTVASQKKKCRPKRSKRERQNRGRRGRAKGSVLVNRRQTRIFETGRCTGTPPRSTHVALFALLFSFPRGPTGTAWRNRGGGDGARTKRAAQRTTPSWHSRAHHASCVARLPCRDPDKTVRAMSRLGLGLALTCMAPGRSL